MINEPSSEDGRIDIAATVATQSSNILQIYKELESVKTLLYANNKKDELHAMERRLLFWRTVSGVLICCCLLLFLLAI